MTASVAASPTQVAHLLDPRDGTIRVFTFWLAEAAYAVSIQHIHSVVQDDQDIRPVPAAGPGLLGTVWYQGAPVPVYDFAQRLGVDSGHQAKSALVETLDALEAEHVEQLADLERTAREKVPYTGPRDPEQCAFGQWYAAFQTRDEGLREILEHFDEPHRRLHELVDEVLMLIQGGNDAEALERLEVERTTSLRRLRTLFSEAREQIREASRTVLLFLTDEGQTPRVGLRIDEIDDVVSFSANVFVPADQVRLPVSPAVRQMLLGYLKEGDRQAILIQPTLAFQ